MQISRFDIQKLKGEVEDCNDERQRLRKLAQTNKAAILAKVGNMLDKEPRMLLMKGIHNFTVDYELN